MATISRKLSAETVARLQASNPAVEITYRDLVAEPFGHFTLRDMPAPGERTAVLDEFLGAGVVVIGAPMYNFTVPSQRKACWDRRGVKRRWRGPNARSARSPPDFVRAIRK